MRVSVPMSRHHATTGRKIMLTQSPKRKCRTLLYPLQISVRCHVSNSVTNWRCVVPERTCRKERISDWTDNRWESRFRGRVLFDPHGFVSFIVQELVLLNTLRRSSVSHCSLRISFISLFPFVHASVSFISSQLTRLVTFQILVSFTTWIVGVTREGRHAGSNTPPTFFLHKDSFWGGGWGATELKFLIPTVNLETPLRSVISQVTPFNWNIS